MHCKFKTAYTLLNWMEHTLTCYLSQCVPEAKENKRLQGVNNYQKELKFYNTQSRRKSTGYKCSLPFNHRNRWMWAGSCQPPLETISSHTYSMRWKKKKWSPGTSPGFGWWWEQGKALHIWKRGCAGCSFRVICAKFSCKSYSELQPRPIRVKRPPALWKGLDMSLAHKSHKLPSTLICCCVNQYIKYIYWFQQLSRQKCHFPYGDDSIIMAFSFRWQCPARGSASACRQEHFLLPRRLGSQGQLQAEATARMGATFMNSCL